MDFINDCVAAYSENKKKWVDSGISLNRRPDIMQRNIKSTNCKNPPICRKLRLSINRSKTTRLFLPIRSYCRLIYSSNGIVSSRREKTVENSISPCRSYRIFKALFICSLSNRRIRWNHNWSYCRLHRIQTNFYCPVKAQKEDVNGSSRLQLFSSVFLNKKVS